MGTCARAACGPGVQGVFEEFYVRLMLWWRSRAGRVEAYLARRPYAKPVRVPTVGSVRVAAVQMCPVPATRATDFAEHMYRLTRRAVEDGAELVVFPDHVSLPLLALVPGFGHALAEAGSLDGALAEVAAAEPPEALPAAASEGGSWSHGVVALPTRAVAEDARIGAAAVSAQRAVDDEEAEEDNPEEAAGDDGRIRLADIVSLASTATDRLYRIVFSTLARRFGIHIAAGSALLLQRDGRVLAVSHLFDPHGRVILTQPRTHLRTWERDWGLGSGMELTVVDTPLGRVGTLGAGEPMLFEPMRILWSLGAEIVLAQTADLGPQPVGQFLRGTWARVQESPAYAVQAGLVGEAFGLTFDGMAAVFAPRELTPAHDGILARAPGGSEEEAVVVADLDLQALRSLRVSQPRPLNRSMIGHYLPELYSRPWPWDGA